MIGWVCEWSRGVREQLGFGCEKGKDIIPRLAFLELPDNQFRSLPSLKDQIVHNVDLRGGLAGVERKAQSNRPCSYSEGDKSNSYVAEKSSVESRGRA